MLEERVVSSRGLHRPRRVRRQRSHYLNRPRGSVHHETPVDYRAAVVILTAPPAHACSPPEEFPPPEAPVQEVCYA